MIVKVVFACTGNTCRSPMAEYMLKDMLVGTELEGQIEVASTGTSARRGAPAAKNTKKVLEQHDVSGAEMHQSQPVNSIDWEEGDLVLTMTRGHKSRLDYLEDQGVKVKQLKEFAGDGGNISDPVGGDLQRYEGVYQELEPLLDEVVNQLEKQV